MPSEREQSQADCGGEAATQGQSNLGRERHTRGQVASSTHGCANG